MSPASTGTRLADEDLAALLKAHEAIQRRWYQNWRKDFERNVDRVFAGRRAIAEGGPSHA